MLGKLYFENIKGKELQFETRFGIIMTVSKV
jgi:hypothetical protein